jgi:hypothetical protein
VGGAIPEDAETGSERGRTAGGRRGRTMNGNDKDVAEELNDLRSTVESLEREVLSMKKEIFTRLGHITQAITDLEATIHSELS